MNDTCFLFGHRTAEDRLLPEIEREAERLRSEYGIHEFIIGNYGRFDRIAASAIINLKKKYGDIRLTMLLPYYRENAKLPDGFDAFLLPEGSERIPKRFSIVYANRSMIVQCDCIICYVHYIASNSYTLYQFARKRGKNIILLQ